MRTALLIAGTVGAAAVFGLGATAGHAIGADQSSPADHDMVGMDHAGVVVDFVPPSTPAQKITDALAAGPAEIRAKARVVDYPAKVGDPYPELRPGSNGWTCFPDYVPSEGDDPICYNRAGLQWLDAYYAGKDPHLTQIGIMYRLRGGSDASLVDPAAAEPPAGAQWMLHGPHIVVLPTERLDLSDYPTTPGNHPWVMFPGTPYEHLHLPVSGSAVGQVVIAGQPLRPRDVPVLVAVVDLGVRLG